MPALEAGGREPRPAPEPAPPIRWIAGAAEWASFAPRLHGCRTLALDVEADGFHRYPERLALLQLALPDDHPTIVDPLAYSDLPELGRVLADPSCQKLIHAASYDLRSLQRDLDFTVRGLYDTAIAAQFLGLERTGLAAVLGEVLGLDFNKSKRLQRMDWSLRPLPADAVAYAASDVAHLCRLAAALQARIAALGREDWVAEECSRLEQVPADAMATPDEACLQLKGARDLDDRGRAILRALLLYREREALRLGRPPYRVLSNAVLLSLAAEPGQRLEQVAGLGRSYLGPRRRDLLACIAAGRQAPPLPWPRRGPGPRWTPVHRQRLEALKAWRDQSAAQLGLAAGTVWSAKHLDQLALHPRMSPEALDRGAERDGLPWVRNWQWRTLGDSLGELLRQLDRPA
mgnify:CR=1 FL=1